MTNDEKFQVDPRNPPNEFFQKEILDALVRIACALENVTDYTWALPAVRVRGSE